MSKRSKEKEFGQIDRAELSALIVEKFRAFPQKKYTIKSLSSALGGDSNARKMTQAIVYQLIEDGIVLRMPEGKYMLMSDQLPGYEGVVDMMASGSMYVIVEGLEKDIFVTSKFGANALHGDRVRVIVTHKRRNGVMEGEITEVIERNKRNYVGVVELSKNYAFVKVDSRKVPMDIFVPIKDGSKLENGHKVLVHITDWAKGAKSPVGEVLDVFGFVGDNNAEMHAILAEYDLPYKFEDEVERAAESIPDRITDKDYKERRDCRGITTFTIDPADAKDFDDALSIRSIGEGLWEVGVHIADVTHYVQPGSVVDVEGENRATSVYLVDRTVPMLPEKLSNGLCSLRPNEEKLCFSAIFEMDAEANITKEWIGRSVILSDKRFTYADAQQIIETGEGEYKEDVLTMHKLAQVMRAARFKHGAITFEREEAKFDLDENGKPLGVYFKEQKESNQLVEEFMLLANRKVAEFVGKKRGAGANAQRTFVYRVHDKPNSDKLARFSNFILRFGYYFKTDQTRNISRQMNELMAEIKGKSEENLVSTLAIRTMAKAFYTTENIGHYGLAFDYYTHFTSPIRRYPDMMVHRLLAHYLAGGSSVEKDPIEKLCEHSSDMEVRAAEAERASIKYKMVEFMLDRLDQEFAGHISGVTEWGAYVELDDTHIEGLVSMREMQGDFFVFNEDDYAIVGQDTGVKYTLGDAVTVKMLRGDLARKQIDFQLVSDTGADMDQSPKHNQNRSEKTNHGTKNEKGSSPKKRRN